jgi:hypothetical protein
MYLEVCAAAFATSGRTQFFQLARTLLLSISQRHH